MLSTSYLAGLSDGLVELYSQLEADIIADMAKRLKRLGSVTDATLWQAKIFQEAGGLQEDINKWVEKYDKKAETQLKALFKEALEKSAAKDVAQLNKAGLSDSQQQIMDATVKKVASAGIVAGSKKVKEDADNGFIKMFSSVQRATMTIASSASNDFVTQANAAYMQVVSGAFDYDTALKNGLIELANKGATTVEYTDSGKTIKRSVEGMLRTNIMTGINQTATRVTLDNCNDLDCDLVEVSAHMGARPEHEAWQGKIYSLNPDNKKYPYFYEVCGYGTPTGICGINCRHSFYPYFEGTEPMYSKGELDEYKDATVTYTTKDKNGKETKHTITQYEGEQKQRFMERQIRKYKRQVSGLEELDAESPECLEAKNKLYQWQKANREFTSETGLRRDYAREFIGTKDGKQPKGKELKGNIIQIKHKNENSDTDKEMKSAEYNELQKSFSDKNITLEKDVANLNYNLMKDVDEIIQEINLPKLTNSIKITAPVTTNLASINLKGELKLSAIYFSNDNLLQDELNLGVSKGFYPANCNTKQALIRHELVGHGLERFFLLRDNSIKDKNSAWKSCTIAEKIVRQAVDNIQKIHPELNEIKLRKDICSYAMTSYSETMAYAIEDVYSNKSEAQLLSKEIEKISMNMYYKILTGVVL